MTPIGLHRLRKVYGTTVAIDSVDLTIEAGHLFFLLGPSGCGKTTLLRMIAGFIEPTAGTVTFGERDVTKVPPNRRQAGMVFQSYALWPHMTVLENVGFGLAVRRLPKAEAQRKARRALELVQMAEYAERKPNQLSGGQQQRVALARALAFEPTVLLLDEPLSNLDAKLRLEMRSEIRRICTELGMTAVYVTHDQKEALSMADRMAVLRAGLVIQEGEPRQLYERPATRFVADFLGETNFIDGTVVGTADGWITVDSPIGRLRGVAATSAPSPNAAVTVSIRPEAIAIDSNPDAGLNAIQGVRRSSVFLGELAQHTVECGGKVLKISELNPRPFGPPGSEVTLAARPNDTVVIVGGSDGTSKASGA
ncbi:MAG: ABC transporter ATP-binding protein [Phycisphaerales bacterium]|nr:ABC transporter ATP-binding protein [Phycisphaerales bacterium]